MNKTVELTNQEMWRLLDAITSYKKDYSLSGSVVKSLDTASKKIENLLNGK